MDETHETPPPDDAPPPRPPRPAFLDAPSEPAPVPPKTGWWRSLDRASRIALGVAVGLLVLALVVGVYGVSRMNRSSTSVNVTAGRRAGRGGFAGFGGGRGGMMRDIRMQSLTVAATTIGVDESDLENELASGKSIADVAKEHNVDPQKVIDAIVAAERKQIDADVKAGSIPQALASRIEASLPQMVAARVNTPGGRGAGFGAFRGGGGPPPPPTTAPAATSQ